MRIGSVPCLPVFVTAAVGASRASGVGALEFLPPAFAAEQVDADLFLLA